MGWHFYPIVVTDKESPPGFFPPNPAEGGVLPDGTPSGESCIATIKRLVAAADSKVFYEDVG